MVTKVAMDQALFAPSFLCVFVTAVSTLQGLGIREIKENLSQNYVDIVLTNWKIWPATQLINFYFVPFQHRILVSKIKTLSFYQSCLFGQYWVNTAQHLPGDRKQLD